MERRTLIVVLLVVLLSLGVGTPSVLAAADDLKLVINGAEVTSDPPPFIEANRTFVPLRLISEKMGSTVYWEPKQQTITIWNECNKVVLQINNRVMTVNDQATEMDVAPTIKDSRTFIPIRYVSQALGTTPIWDNFSRTITILKTTTASPTSQDYLYVYNNGVNAAKQLQELAVEWEAAVKALNLEQSSALRQDILDRINSFKWYEIDYPSARYGKLKPSAADYHVFVDTLKNYLTNQDPNKQVTPDWAEFERIKGLHAKAANQYALVK
jgi:hypothetical protein